MKSNVSSLCAWTAVTFMVTAAMLGAEEKPSGGFGIGPGMVLVENIRPGDGEVDVNKSTGFSFEVENGTKEKHVFSVFARAAKGMISSWEMGYESVPDVSWLRLDKTEVEVPPNSKAKVNLFIKVPDKPELYNRKFMAVVGCSPGRSEQNVSSVGLIVASRVQIETASNDEVDGLNAGSVSLVPSSWLMPDARPGDSWRKVFKIRNNTKEEHTYSVKRIADVEKDPSRHDRYYGQGCIKLDKESWMNIKDKDMSFTLKPNEVKELTVNVAVGKKALPQKRYEELLFLQDETGHVQFLRLRTETVATTADAQPNDQKAP